VRKVRRFLSICSSCKNPSEAIKELDTSTLVTKTDLEIALANQMITTMKWMTGMLLAQGALIVTLIQYFK